MLKSLNHLSSYSCWILNLNVSMCFGGPTERNCVFLKMQKSLPSLISSSVAQVLFAVIVYSPSTSRALFISISFVCKFMDCD